MRKPSPNKFFLLIIVMLISSCSALSEQPEKLSEKEACSGIKAVVLDHKKQFSHFKKSLRRVDNLNTWSAKQVFPTAEQCKIWEWSNGLLTYICNWPSKDGKENAIKDYATGNGILKSCLGTKWQSETNTSPRGGERTLYTHPSSQTAISIRYLKESRSWIEKWHTVVAIGDRNNLKAKVQ